MASSCRVCREDYGTEGRVPVSLQCGHSFCRLCLLIIQEECQLKCPTCHQVHNGLPVQDLPINYDLMVIVSDDFSSASPAPKSMSVMVKDKEGTCYQVLVQPKTKVSALKIILEAQHDLDMEGCSLTYRRQHLQDSKSLQDYRIPPESIIHMEYNSDQTGQTRVPKIPTELLEAIDRADAAKVHELLKIGLPVNSVSPRPLDNGGSPLHLAAEGGHQEIVRELLQKGASINAKDNNGLTALHLAAWSGQAGTVVLLLVHDADKNAKAQGRTLVHWAAVGGHTKVLEAVKTKCDLTELAANDTTALHLAAEYGNLDTVEWLLTQGLNVNETDKWGRTAEDYALGEGHKQIATHLHCKAVQQETEFLRAVGAGDMVKLLILLKAKVNVECKSTEADEWGHRAVHRAAVQGHLKVLQILFATGAKRNPEDDMGNTPMHYAAGGNNQEVLKFLKQNGCSVKACNNFNFTPLHFAAMKGNREVVAWLLYEGVRPDIKTNSGYTASDIARKMGYKTLADKLSGYTASAEGETDVVEVIQRLGKGAFGEAYLATLNSRKLVVKMIPIITENEKKLALQELKILKNMKHPNIVSYLGGEVKGSTLHILMEFCSGGDLAKRIEEQKKNKSHFEEKTLQSWTLGICMALEYLHNRKVIHRDIKPQNIFLSGSETIKLGDFGLARVLTEDSFQAKTLLGTLPYMSPEVINSKPYDHKCDMYSLGCCLYELAALERGFPYTRVNVPGKYSRSYKNLVKTLLNEDPKKRPSASEALKTSYFKIGVMSEKEAEDRRLKNPLIRLLLQQASSPENT